LCSNDHNGDWTIDQAKRAPDRSIPRRCPGMQTEIVEADAFSTMVFPLDRSTFYSL